MVAYYSNRLSYQSVEDLVERISGDKLLSDQKIWEIVVNKAVEVSSQWQSEIGRIKQSIKSESQIAPTVDIYDPLAQEILLFDDGIGVKKQKAHRLSRGFLGVKTEQEENRKKNQDVVIGETDESGQKQKRKTVITDVVLLQTPKGSFEYLTSPIDNQGQPLIPLEEIIKCQLKSYYHDCNFP